MKTAELKWHCGGFLHRADDKDNGRLRPKPSRRARGGQFTKEDEGFERAEDYPVSERKRESERFPTKRVVPVSKACDKSVKYWKVFMGLGNMPALLTFPGALLASGDGRNRVPWGGKVNRKYKGRATWHWQFVQEGWGKWVQDGSYREPSVRGLLLFCFVLFFFFNIS